MLTRCREDGITLNRERFIAVAPPVNFCSHTLSSEGFSADVDEVSAVGDAPSPPI